MFSFKRLRAKKRRPIQRAPRTDLRVESLEKREVPALTVFLSYYDGYILNVCDNNPAASTLRFEPKRSTTSKGIRSPNRLGPGHLI